MRVVIYWCYFAYLRSDAVGGEDKGVVVVQGWSGEGGERGGRCCCGECCWQNAERGLKRTSKKGRQQRRMSTMLNLSNHIWNVEREASCIVFSIIKRALSACKSIATMVRQLTSAANFFTRSLIVDRFSRRSLPSLVSPPLARVFLP